MGHIFHQELFFSWGHVGFLWVCIKANLISCYFLLPVLKWDQFWLNGFLSKRDKVTLRRIPIVCVRWRPHIDLSAISAVSIVRTYLAPYRNSWSPQRCVYPKISLARGTPKGAGTITPSFQILANFFSVSFFLLPLSFHFPFPFHHTFTPQDTPERSGYIPLRVWKLWRESVHNLCRLSSLGTPPLEVADRSAYHTRVLNSYRNANVAILWPSGKRFWSALGSLIVEIANYRFSPLPVLSSRGRAMTSGAMVLGSAQPIQARRHFVTCMVNHRWPATPWPIGDMVHRLHFSKYQGLYTLSIRHDCGNGSCGWEGEISWLVVVVSLCTLR